MGQFYTTPPAGIVLGWSLKLLGWIPTVAIPNPDQPPLRIYSKHSYFCTKKKILGTHDRTHSKIHPNRIPPTILIFDFVLLYIEATFPDFHSVHWCNLCLFTIVTLSCLNSINAIDVTRCCLMLIVCWMFKCSNVQMLQIFQCSNVIMF